MDSSLVGDFLSPEWTVTSLMSNTGRLRSSLLPPEHSIRYRNKDYDSASAALDAYISDFERSCQNCRSSGGRLVLSTPITPRVSALRNKDVLRESLTETELDFLNLPVSSLHHGANRDRLSMTTDELLSIPTDGSMPVTHTSASIQGLRSRCGASCLHCSSSSSGRKICAGLRSSLTKPQLSCHQPQLTGTSRTSRFMQLEPMFRGRGAATFETHDNTSRAAGSEFTEPSSFHPHCFTTSKTDMDHSGSSSLPDSNCPALVQGRSDLLPLPTATEPELWDEHAVRSRAPSWVAELEDDDPDQTRSQISLLAAERRSSDIVDVMFRDNRMEGLIQKADRVLNSLCQSCDEADRPAVSPVSTDELLSSSSRGPSFTRDPAATAGGGTEAQRERGAETLGSGFHGNTIWKQPGPVEALKQMLFRLQAVETKLQQREAAAETCPGRKQTAEAELEGFAGGPSLHRALHHLSRLKLLVDEPREEEKDEGRYSSSSVRS